MQLSFDLEAIVEGDIFDDPCRPCQLQRISCIVSPRSTRCATCVRAGHACSSTFSIKLSRSHGSLTAVQARIASAETVLGHRIGTSTETLSKLQKTQVEISNLQVELDILRRRRTRMRSYEYSSSPHRASSSPAFSEISSVPNASVTGIPSSPGEVPALAPSLEIVSGLPPGPIDFSGSFGSLRPFIDLSGSGEVPAPLPPVPATGHLDISDRFLIAPNNPITQPSVEVAPAAFAESVVGDFGVPGFLDAYHTMSILLSINLNF